MGNEIIKNEQDITIETMDEFVTQLYAIMKRDQLENKHVLFGHSRNGNVLEATQDLRITESKEEVVIELR